MSHTTDRNDPRLGHGSDKGPIPQHEVYLILSDEERAKGFTRPYRDSYVHKGKDLTKYHAPEPLAADDSLRSHYVAFCPIKDKTDGVTGIYLNAHDYKYYKDGYVPGCGVTTTMSRPISETYARDPGFYGSTYCCGCGYHIDVEEFVWKGTNDKVGS